MRTSFAVAAGLLAVASAGTTTITDTVDVTITSCEPTVTNCPYKGGAGGDHTWSDWVSASTTKPVKPATTSSYDPSWSDWESTTTTKPVKPATTSSYDPNWEDWETTTTPVKPATTSTYYDPNWSDWESTSTPVKPATTSSYYDPNWSDWESTSTPVKPATTSTYDPNWSDWSSTWSTSASVAAASTSVAAASTGIWTYAGSSTPVSPAVATYTGAANVNAGSFALAGLAAAAVMVIA